MTHQSISTESFLPSNFQRKGILFVVSAPSGAGKSTICHHLRRTPDFVFSVSCTTRPKRAGEENGVDYYFLTPQQFEQRSAAGDFLEYAQVHGNYYGTLYSEVIKHMRQGKDVLLDIDIQGARSIRAHYDPEVRDALVDIFMIPPTVAELERRLRKRGTESEEEIRHRLERGLVEMESWREYKYIIFSESIEGDLQKFRSIMSAERYLTRRLADR